MALGLFLLLRHTSVVDNHDLSCHSTTRHADVGGKTGPADDWARPS
jgi:hypothetical protein